MKTLFWEINSRFAENNLPQVFKIKLKELRKEITSLERKLEETPNNNSFRSKRFEKQQQLEATINEVEELTVYNKFKSSLINQADLQSNLNSNQALLSTALFSPKKNLKL